MVDFYALYRGRDRGLYWVEKGGYNGIAVAKVCICSIILSVLFTSFVLDGALLR